MTPKATKVPAPIGTSSTRGEPANPSIKSKTPSATSTEGKGSSAPEIGVAASCVARASGALIAGAARTERLLLSGACLCAGAAWNADADSTAQSTRKDLIVDMAVETVGRKRHQPTQSIPVNASRTRVVPFPHVLPAFFSSVSQMYLCLILTCVAVAVEVTASDHQWRRCAWAMRWSY